MKSISQNYLDRLKLALQEVITMARQGNSLSGLQLGRIARIECLFLNIQDCEACDDTECPEKPTQEESE